MSRLRRVLAILGGLLLAAGIFVPEVTIPASATIAYEQRFSWFDDAFGRWKVLLVGACAVVAVLGGALARYRYVPFAGLAALVPVAMSWINFRVGLASLQNNPAAGDNMFRNAQLGLALPSMALGALMLILVAAVRERDGSRPPEPAIPAPPPETSPTPEPRVPGGSARKPFSIGTRSDRVVVLVVLCIVLGFTVRTLQRRRAEAAAHQLVLAILDDTTFPRTCAPLKGGREMWDGVDGATFGRVGALQGGAGKQGSHPRRAGVADLRNALEDARGRHAGRITCEDVRALQIAANSGKLTPTALNAVVQILRRAGL